MVEKGLLKLTLKLFGTVQRVGFRRQIVYYIHQNMPEVTGFVLNLPDGSVELVAEGKLAQLRTILNYATKEVPQSIVRNFEHELSPIAQRVESEFSVKS